MAEIDKMIIQIFQTMEANVTLKRLKQIFDDLFTIFVGSTKQLHKLCKEINKIHPCVQFTMQHTTPETENVDNNCGYEKLNSIPYLDTSCSIKEGQIILDLYHKPTDRIQYLLPDSCHPLSNIKNIPLSLAIKITRVCSEIETGDMRHS